MNAVELSRVTKRFGGAAAIDAVNFTARAGEIHALLGESGAGKSTLMGVLAGMLQPEAGVIYVKGNRALLRSPGDALERGVGMLRRQSALIDSLTAAENALLSQRQSKQAAAKRIAELGTRYGLAVDPNAPAWRLAAGERQRAELLILLARGARVLVF
ncbi:MAG TPA: ATP-binding cassette domain-containing protein, partial [Herpetosiphonaceae bacterium]